MQKKYIVGISIAVVFLSVALYSYFDSAYEAADFDSAKKSGANVQIKCEVQKGKPAEYDSDKNQLSFWGKDESGNLTKVVYYGSKPNNFDVAPYVVLTGRYENGAFMASEIMTKCPSKYESTLEDVQKQSASM